MCYRASFPLIHLYHFYTAFQDVVKDSAPRSSLNNVTAMKLIRSTARENAQLKCENEQLRAELQRKDQVYRNSWARVRSGPAFEATKSSSRAKPTVPVIRSYQRPTAASTNRAQRTNRADSSTSGVPRSTSGLQWEDGKLITQQAIGDANFSKPTRSSSSKAHGKRYMPHELYDTEPSTIDPSPSRVRWIGEPPDKLPDEHELDQVDSSSDDVSTTCTKCDWMDKEAKDKHDNSLETRSRLLDKKFYDTPASVCYVRYRVQTRLLKAALRLAQETLWCALREHWPDIQLSHYLEGPETVRFGRGELYQVVGDEEYPTKANNMCEQPRSAVVYRILEVADLRNAICHPGPCTTRSVDNLIQTAQGLAVVLQDEKRAFKIRKLRDELQSHAAESYNKIETYAALACLPYAKPWPLHLQFFFYHTRLGFLDEDGKKCSDAVKLAAREWKLKYCSPGSLDPRYEARVEEAKSFVRTTEHGRRASVAALPGDEVRKTVVKDEWAPPQQPEMSRIGIPDDSNAVCGW